MMVTSPVMGRDPTGVTRDTRTVDSPPTVHRGPAQDVDVADADEVAGVAAAEPPEAPPELDVEPELPEPLDVPESDADADDALVLPFVRLSVA